MTFVKLSNQVYFLLTMLDVPDTEFSNRSNCLEHSLKKELAK